MKKIACLYVIVYQVLWLTLSRYWITFKVLLIWERQRLCIQYLDHSNQKTDFLALCCAIISKNYLITSTTFFLRFVFVFQSKIGLDATPVQAENISHSPRYHSHQLPTIMWVVQAMVENPHVTWIRIPNGPSASTEVVQAAKSTECEILRVCFRLTTL
jgi:hypothetical protein